MGAEKCMKIYFAGPLFSKAEKKFNKEMAEFLTGRGFEVYLPQEKSETSVGKVIFAENIREILSSDIVTAVVDGECIDSGTAFEIGYAYANNKKVIGIMTDSRTFTVDNELNIMLAFSMEIVHEQNIEDLKNSILDKLNR